MCFPPLHFLKGEMCWGEISLHIVHQSSSGRREHPCPSKYERNGQKKTLHGGSQQLILLLMSPPAAHMTCTCCCSSKNPLLKHMFSIKTTGWWQAPTEHVRRASEKVWRDLFISLLARDLACQLATVCLECSALRLQCIHATFSIAAGSLQILKFQFHQPYQQQQLLSHHLHHRCLDSTGDLLFHRSRLIPPD